MKKNLLLVACCLTIMMGCRPYRPQVTESNTYVDSVIENDDEGAGMVENASVDLPADSGKQAAPQSAEKKVFAHSEDGYVNIRKQPTVASDTLGRLIMGGEGAEYLGTSGEWYQVLYHGKKGYVKCVYAVVDSTGNVTSTHP